MNVLDNSALMAAALMDVPAGSLPACPPAENLESIAARIRMNLVEMSCRAKSAHLGGSLSCVDILTAAYWHGLDIDPRRPDDPLRDRLIFSKGHAATALYTALAFRGFFPESWLTTYAQPGSCLPEQPAPHSAPGVEAATGSLGHGLSLGIGMALAGRIRKERFRVCVVMSDGECQEGSVWEAAMMAPIHGLENVIAVVDYNKWQATGRSNEVLALSPLKQKWEAFGWSAYEVGGHDVNELARLIRQVPDGSGKPVALIAHTIKGKGISFIEDDNNWHYRSPSPEEVEQARVELGLAR